MANKLENILSKIIKYGLYAILLTPLAFWPRALFPFLTPKFILFQILVEIVFAAWLILLFRSGLTRILADLRRNYVAIALFIFLLASFVSALFGVDFSRSFWGIGPRMTGLFAELHFLAWFLMLASVSKSDFDMVRYLNFSFFVSLVVAATAFYQNSEWGLSFGYGIFNNPTFVAPYLIFHFFWSLYQMLSSKKWFFGAGTALLLFVIIFAQIRGAVLGFFIGIFALGIGLIFSDILNRRSRILLSTFYFLLSISLIGLWYLRDNPAVQKFSPIKRVTGISLRETTVQTRILAWQVALKGFPAMILLGTGPENFNFLFNAHYNPEFLKFGGGGFGETWFDKPHNVFLEVLAETGITGILAYFFIWLAAVFALYKLFKSGEKLLPMILTGAFISYFVSVFFSFDSFGSWFGLYLFLSFLASLSNNANQNLGLRISQIANTVYLQSALFAIVMISLALLYINYSIWRANVADADALRIFSKSPAQSIVLFKKSLTYFSPYKPEYQFDLIASVSGAVEKGIPLPNLEDMINFSLSEADKAVAAHPKDAAKYTDMARIYNILGTKGRDPEILAQAESFGKKSLELSPNRQETFYYLARTALLKNDAKLAIKWTNQAVEADPTIGQSHWYFGLTYIADGQKAAGVAEIKKAMELGYSPQNKNETDFIRNLGL